jgi:hypothetical protein
MPKLIVYGLLMWFVILALAILNAAMRESVFKRFGELTAQQLSSITLAILIFAATYAFLRIGDFHASGAELWYLGIMWTAMTMAFEFLFFHYATHHPWSELLQNYYVWEGRLWPLVLAATLTAPRLMALL